MRIGAKLSMISALAFCIVSCDRSATGSRNGNSSTNQLDSSEIHSAWIAAAGKELVAAAVPGASVVHSGNASMKIAEYDPSSQGVCAIIVDGDGKQAKIIVAADLRGSASDLSSWRLHEYVVASGDGPKLKTQMSKLEITAGGQISPCQLTTQLDAYLSRNGRADNPDLALRR